MEQLHRDAVYSVGGDGGRLGGAGGLQLATSNGGRSGSVKSSSHEPVQQRVDGAVGVAQQYNDRQPLKGHVVFLVEVHVQTDQLQHTHTHTHTHNQHVRSSPRRQLQYTLAPQSGTLSLISDCFRCLLETYLFAQYTSAFSALEVLDDNC